MRNHFDLTGRRALVTGSSRGIGRAIALALAEYGADLCVHYHGRQADAEEVAKKARGFGVNSVVVQADIGDVDGPAKIAEAAIAGLGGIDILVLNASMEYRTPWNEITVEAFQRQTDVNLRSTMQLIQLLVPAMIERGWGRVVTLGSVPGNDIVIPDPSVSRKHVGVRKVEGGYEVADFGSTNGIYVNGERTPKKKLAVGDVIRVGSIEMIFRV